MLGLYLSMISRDGDGDGKVAHWVSGLHISAWFIEKRVNYDMGERGSRDAEC